MYNVHVCYDQYVMVYCTCPEFALILTIFVFVDVQFEDHAKVKGEYRVSP